MRSKVRSAARPRRPSLRSSGRLSSLAHIIGVSVRATAAETRMAAASVSANSRNRRPTMSPMNSRGISTAMSDTVSDRIVNPICPAPLKAAARGASPASM